MLSLVGKLSAKGPPSPDGRRLKVHVPNAKYTLDSKEPPRPPLKCKRELSEPPPVPEPHPIPEDSWHYDAVEEEQNKYPWDYEEAAMFYHGYGYGKRIAGYYKGNRWAGHYA